MSAKPDVRAIELSEKDEFFVLASDGIFDVFDNQQVRSQMRSEVRSRDPRCELARHVAGGAHRALGEQPASSGTSADQICIRRRLAR